VDKSITLLTGTILSLVAAVIIQALIYPITMGLDPIMLYTPPYAYYLAALVIIGLAVYKLYSDSTEEARWHMKNVSPVALLLATASLATGVAGREIALLFIPLAYFVEEIVGLKLAKDFTRYSKMGSLAFQLGMSVFVLSLPLIILDNRAGYVAMVGNSVKMLGLAVIAVAILRTRAAKMLPH